MKKSGEAIQRQYTIYGDYSAIWKWVAIGATLCFLTHLVQGLWIMMTMAYLILFTRHQWHIVTIIIAEVLLMIFIGTGHPLKLKCLKIAERPLMPLQRN